MQRFRLPVYFEIDLTDKPNAAKQRQAEVAHFSFIPGNITLQRIGKIEQLLGPLALNKEIVEVREDADTAFPVNGRQIFQLPG